MTDCQPDYSQSIISMRGFNSNRLLVMTIDMALPPTLVDGWDVIW